MINTEGGQLSSIPSRKGILGLVLERTISFGDFFSALAKIVFALGVLVVFSYVLRIRFLPSGLSLSDGVLFVFAALSGGIVLCAALMFGMLLSYWILYGVEYFFAKADGKADAKWRMSKALKSRWMLFFSIIFLIVFVVIGFFATSSFVVFLLSAFGSGFFLNIALLADRQTNFFQGVFKDSPGLMISIAVLVAIFLMLVHAFSPVIDATMRVIGVRQESVYVALGKDNQRILRDAASAFAASPIACEMKNPDDLQMVKVDVLWGGLGARSLLAIHDAKNPTELMPIEMDSAQVWSVRDRKKDCALSGALVTPTATIAATPTTTIAVTSTSTNTASVSTPRTP